MDKLKISTKITTVEEAAKALQSVEKSFNKLLEKVNSSAEKELKETEGETGDIQVAQNLDKSYTFLVKTKDGWKTPVIGDSAIQFKDKPSTLSAEKKESIDEIESKDSSTGDTKAKKTIYDEKSDKFVLPRPDYESDWTDVTNNTNYVFTHNLETQIFKLVQVIFKDDSSRIFYPGIAASEEGTSDTGIYAYAVSDNAMDISTGNTNIYYHDNTSLGTGQTFVTDGYIKLMLWK